MNCSALTDGTEMLTTGTIKNASVYAIGSLNSKSNMNILEKYLPLCACAYHYSKTDDFMPVQDGAIPHCANAICF